MNAPSDTLPRGWVYASGDDLFDVIRGVTYSKEDARSEPFPGSVGVLRAGNILDGRLTLDDVVYVPKRCVRENQLVRRGDVVIAMSSGSATVVGKAAIATEDLDAISFGAFCGVARPRSPELQPWLRYFFQTPEYRSITAEQAAGVNINNLRPDHLRTLQIPVPPLAEQRRIVEKLEDMLAASRAVRAALDVTSSMLERLGDAIRAAAVRGLLSGERRSQSGMTPWKELSLEELTLKGAPIIYGILQPGPDVPNGIPYVRPTEMSATGIDVASVRKTAPEIAARYRRAALLPGDVLLSIVGTIGKVAVVPPELAGANITQSSVRIRPNPELLTSEFLELQLRSPQVRAQFDTLRLGTGVPRLNVSQVRSIRVPVPTIEEQAVITALAKHRLAALEGLMETLSLCHGRLADLERVALNRAFRGTFAPQDSQDEPASTLLDRIRAERAGAPTILSRRARTRR